MRDPAGKPENGRTFWRSNSTFWCALFVVVVSWFTYFHNFEHPDRYFWDESYHVVTAQKYLNDTFYMAFHPPLGKMLIALGQHIYEPEAKNDHFLGVHRAQSYPDDFSIKGYRLVPALLGWLTAPLIFFIFLLLLKSPVQSMLLSFLYVFDNALIVHLRGAMLESAMLFFSMLTIALFLLLIRKKDRKKTFYALSFLFGVSMACAVLVKVLAYILILLIPAALLQFRRSRLQSLRFLFYTLLGFAVTFFGIWYIHVSLVTTVRDGKAMNGGYYSASDEYRAVLDAGEGGSRTGFAMAVQHSLWRTITPANIPSVDLCKVQENGSPPVLWPFGSHSIIYASHMEENGLSRYLYLQGNPVVWLLGLFGILFSFAYVLSALLFWQDRASPKLYYIATFLVMYGSYMVAVSFIHRVLYLYHYFIPLIFSFFLFGLAFAEIKSLGPWKISRNIKETLLAIMGLCIFLSFQFYRPLTYFEPITDEAFSRRAVWSMWELHCLGCPRVRPWMNPTTPLQPRNNAQRQNQVTEPSSETEEHL